MDYPLELNKGHFEEVIFKLRIKEWIELSQTQILEVWEWASWLVISKRKIIIQVSSDGNHFRQLYWSLSKWIKELKENSAHKCCHNNIRNLSFMSSINQSFQHLCLPEISKATQIHQKSQCQGTPGGQPYYFVAPKRQLQVCNGSLAYSALTKWDQ